MDVTGHGKSDKKDKSEKMAPPPHSSEPLPDEAAAQTQVDLVSPFAHPRGVKDAKSTTFDLWQFVTRHPLPVALSCLALGGTIAAVILKRRRRDRGDARINRLRQAFVDAANGAG